MIKTLPIFLSLLYCANLVYAQPGQNVVSADVKNFWLAYDKITGTKNSGLQYKYLDSLYFQKATPGLQAIRRVRNYSAEDYINAINNYPQFWASVRKNTQKIGTISRQLEAGIKKLRLSYPDLKPATIYFTIGALRTNGTTLDSLVLIGSELAMTDKNTVSSEFPAEVRAFRKTFFDTDPIHNLVLLNIHEYIHTQQHPGVNNLLSIAIREGVAEFVSVKVMGLPSATPAIAFGKKNAARVREKFEQEMYYINNQNKWFWSDAPNEFNIRDLGYYIGYQLCENYYDKAVDKQEAIKKMIGLDYENEAAVEAFVEISQFFSASLDELYRRFESRQPTVTGIKQFANHSKNVSTRINQITVEFSEPLNGHNTGIDFGGLGQDAFPKNDVTKRFWSADKRSWTITVELVPNKKYQLLISNNFRTDNDVPLKAYLIEFETGNE